MNRTHYTTNATIDDPRIDAFIADILAVYEKHDMAIGHEDHLGAMLIEPLTNRNKAWIDMAMVNIFHIPPKSI